MKQDVRILEFIHPSGHRLSEDKSELTTRGP